MRILLYFIVIIPSLSTLAQEKGPICIKHCYLNHPNNTLIGSDQYGLINSSWNTHVFNGIFQVDPLDSTITEISLTFGDSLIYHTGLTDWGPCIAPDLEIEDVYGVISILEGEIFPVTTVKTISSSPDWDYSISQDAVIRTSCLLELKAAYIPNSKSHFVRVKFSDGSLDIPDAPNETSTDYSIWLSNENTLTIKAVENSVLKVNLYSLSGQLVQEATIGGSQNIDISTLPKGCYMVLSSNKNGLEKRLKFVR